MSSWYGQQFSQEYHGETCGRTDSTSALSYGCKNVEGSACTSAQETLENVEDGMARWTSYASVERGAVVVTA